MTTHYSQLGRAGESRETHQQHVEQMRDYYSRTASQYNAWHCDTTADSNHNFAVKEVLGLLNSGPGASLLDVGCGTGRCIRAALDAGFEAHGIDISPDLLALAEKELSIPREKLHCADATSLPFGDNSFDVCCILGALHHSAMPHTIIAELIRVARRAVVVSDEANHFHGGVRQSLITLSLFKPIYRLIFRREPRLTTRGVTSAGDGPSFDFTMEEIVPTLRDRFETVKVTPFYRIGKRQFKGQWLPRLFASQAVAVAAAKRKH